MIVRKDAKGKMRKMRAGMSNVPANSGITMLPEDVGVDEERRRNATETIVSSVRISVFVEEGEDDC